MFGSGKPETEWCWCYKLIIETSDKKKAEVCQPKTNSDNYDAFLL